MKTIRVQYTVNPDFAKQNQENIKKVMEEMRAQNNPDVKYAAYIGEDGKTFMHVVHYNSAGAEILPGSLDSFKHFQSELKQNLNVSPKVETFDAVDLSFKLF